MSKLANKLSSDVMGRLRGQLVGRLRPRLGDDLWYHLMDYVYIRANDRHNQLDEDLYREDSQ